MITKSQLRQIIVKEIGSVSAEREAAEELLKRALGSTQNKLDKVDDPEEIKSFLTSFITAFLKQSEQEPSNVRQILTNLGNAILKMGKETNKEENSS